MNVIIEKLEELRKLKEEILECRKKYELPQSISSLNKLEKFVTLFKNHHDGSNYGPNANSYSYLLWDHIPETAKDRLKDNGPIDDYIHADRLFRFSVGDVPLGKIELALSHTSNFFDDYKNRTKSILSILSRLFDDGFFIECLMKQVEALSAITHDDHIYNIYGNEINKAALPYEIAYLPVHIFFSALSIKFRSEKRVFHRLEKSIDETIYYTNNCINIPPKRNEKAQIVNNISGNGNAINTTSASNGSSVKMGNVTQTTYVVTSPTAEVTKQMLNDEVKEARKALVDHEDDLGETVHEALAQFLTLARKHEFEVEQLQKVQADLRTMLEDIWIKTVKEDIKTLPQRLLGAKALESFASRTILGGAMGLATAALPVP